MLAWKILMLWIYSSSFPTPCFYFWSGGTGKVALYKGNFLLFICADIQELFCVGVCLPRWECVFATLWFETAQLDCASIPQLELLYMLDLST